MHSNIANTAIMQGVFMYVLRYAPLYKVNYNLGSRRAIYIYCILILIYKIVYKSLPLPLYGSVSRVHEA